MALPELKQQLVQYATGRGEFTGGSDAYSGPVLLQCISQIFRDEYLPLESTERLEVLVKGILRSLLTGRIPGHTARELAILMRDQGLLLKYKPYAVKAANPFGYSVFIQRQGEGFSYQNHLTHKTEVFHILEVLPGGFVFLCRYEDWQRNFERNLFERWLNGEPHPFFDRCRFTPRQGDVFVISELGVVHTVVGCILEEFATASTDMVQRLYDQNDRNNVPLYDTLDTQNRLNSLQLPPSCRQVDMLSGPDIATVEISPTSESFGLSYTFVDSFVRASQLHVSPRCMIPAQKDVDRVTVLRVFSGCCSVQISDDEEYARQSASEQIELKAGQMTVIANGNYFQIHNNGESTLDVSEHRIRPDVALT